MALGAQRTRVYGLVLRQAGWLTGGGILAGVICSLGVSKAMSDLLFGVQAWDIPTLIAVACILGISGLVASFIPARRAASVSPVEALRAE